MTDHTMGSSAFLGPLTLSWRNIALLVPVGLLAGLASPLNVNASTRLTWLGVAAAAQVALTAVYAIGSVLGLARRRLGVFVVVVLASLARAASLVVLTESLGAIDPLPPGLRIVGATVTFTLWGVALGAAIQSWANYREGLKALASNSERALKEAEDLSQEWRRRLDVAVPSPADLAATARALHDDIDARLRPLSHRLWFNITDRSARQRLVSTTLALPFQIPWISALSFFVFTWNAWYVYGWWPSAGAIIAGVIAMDLVLVLGQFLRNRMSRRRGLTTAITIALASFMCALAVALLLTMSDPIIFAVSTLAQIAEILGVQLIAAVSISRRATVRELGQRTEALEHERAEIAAYLHSTVQARWTAAARQLEVASEAGNLDSARLALAGARSLLVGVEAYVSAPPELEDLAQAWDGIATVRIDAPQPLPRNCQAVVARIVEEAIANAVRHGGARTVDVAIQLTEREVNITVDDDGSGAGTAVQPGLGSEWLDTVASWSLTRTTQGSRLVAAVNA